MRATGRRASDHCNADLRDDLPVSGWIGHTARRVLYDVRQRRRAGDGLREPALEGLIMSCSIPVTGSGRVAGGSMIGCATSGSARGPASAAFRPARAGFQLRQGSISIPLTRRSACRSRRRGRLASRRLEVPGRGVFTRPPVIPVSKFVPRERSHCIRRIPLIRPSPGEAAAAVEAAQFQGWVSSRSPGQRLLSSSTAAAALVYGEVIGLAEYPGHRKPAGMLSIIGEASDPDRRLWRSFPRRVRLSRRQAMRRRFR